MNLLSFHVKKFRNIVDSGVVAVDSDVTCLVGKNEAGKSGLLEALYLFNPAYDEVLDADEQYPRWLVVSDRKRSKLADHAPIEVNLELDTDDLEAIQNVLGPNVLVGNQLTVKRKYGGGTTWSFEWSESSAIENIVTSMPPAVGSILSGARELEGLQAALEEAESDESDGSPSQEDIEAAREAIESRGLNDVGVWQRIVNILRDRLPKFFRFTSYNTLPGRIDFHDVASEEDVGPGRSALQTARALLALAGTDLEQLGSEDYELRKGELEAVQIDLTNQVFEYWKQNPDLEVLIDVDKETIQRPNGTSAVARFLDIRLRDRRTGYSNNFSQRSSGFQWFFSFLAAFSAFDEEEAPIVLLDEPALTLHGKAQADFLRFINERLALSTPVLYTTHSPFMVEPDGLSRVRVVEDHGPPTGATVNDGVLASDPDSLFPLQAALGYDIAQNLFVGPHNLVVEGTSDFIYLTVMSGLCATSGRNALDERWRILPAGGATNIPTFVSLVGPHLDVTVLADSDTKGMQRVTNMVERNLLDGHRLVLASAAISGDHADIEDLFSEGDYLALYNRTFSSAIKVNELPEGPRIVKRIERHIGTSFVHGEVAEILLRHYQEMSFTERSLDRFAELISVLNRTLES